MHVECQTSLAQHPLTQSMQEPIPEPTLSRSYTIRIGFIQLTDAAPIIVAAESGLCAALGLEVELSRELGWGSILDRLLLGELDFIHSLGPMPLTATMGIGCTPTDCVGIMALSHHGNAITLPRKYWDQGIRSGKDFATFVRSEKWRRHFSLGVVAMTSSHHYLLRLWLEEIGLTPGKDVDIVIIPPGQFIRNLQAGTIDGACIGEPWNSWAVDQGLGWIVSSSPHIAPQHPEKTIMTTRASLDQNPDVSARLVAALQIAAGWCGNPQHIPEISRLLSRSNYLNLSPSIIARTLGVHTVDDSAKVESGLHFEQGELPLFTTEGLNWLKKCVTESMALTKPLPGGVHGMTRYYPSAVVKNAQLYVKKLASFTLNGFYSSLP